jgi:hypothetical protein
VWGVATGKWLCISQDLVDWTATDLGILLLGAAQTRYGVMAFGDSCFGIGVACPDPGVRAYVTVDGEEWTEVPHPLPLFWERVLSDGPAGVLMIGIGPNDTGREVWRLTP